MQTIVLKLLALVAGLITSAVTHVQLPVLGREPVLGVVALGLVLALAAAVLLLAWVLLRDHPPRRLAAAS